MKRRLVIAAVELVCISVITSVLVLGCSSSSTDGAGIDLTPPPLPSGLRFLNNAVHNGAATVQWDAVNDNALAGYNVYWRGGTEVDTLNANRLFVETTTTTITGLDYETRYYFAVNSVDRSGNESPLSLQINGKPLNTTSPLPPAAVNVVAENIDFPKIMIYWEANTESDIDHYAIYRTTTPASPEAGDSISFITEITRENYTDIAVEPLTTYRYWVTAVDKGGWESEPSAVVSDFILPAVMLSSPVNFAYVSGTPVFRWNAVPGAARYQLFLTSSRIGGELWTTEVDGDVTQVAYGGKTKLISGNTYYWKVGAITRSEINSVSTIGSFVMATP